jgi:FixJ family two-component response regulator
MSKVFLVDDDESVVRGLERTLKAAGFAVDASHSARAFLEHHSAMEAHTTDEPACVILDLRLPELNGLEVQRLLKSDATLPVIFLTGYGTVKASVEAMKQGAFEFLLKPVDIPHFLDVVQRALEASAQALGERLKQTEVKLRLDRLTPREHQVCTLVGNGLLNKQIAAELGLSEKTVKIHRARVMRKLRVHSVAELVRLIDRSALSPH